MDTFRVVILVFVVGFVALSLGLQVLARSRAAKLKGQPLPKLPGSTGERINGSTRALVYFFTPTCAACRAVTPRMKDLAAKGQPVFPIDAMQEPELAQALSVMATPTTVEVQEGRVVAVHIGPVAAEVYQRFT
jgi:thiol-disulfide isomerase/thioredoxin